MMCMSCCRFADRNFPGLIISPRILKACRLADARRLWKSDFTLASFSGKKASEMRTVLVLMKMLSPLRALVRAALATQAWCGKARTRLSMYRSSRSFKVARSFGVPPSPNRSKKNRENDCWRVPVMLVPGGRVLSINISHGQPYTNQQQVDVTVCKEINFQKWFSDASGKSQITAGFSPHIH